MFGSSLTVAADEIGSQASRFRFSYHSAPCLARESNDTLRRKSALLTLEAFPSSSSSSSSSSWKTLALIPREVPFPLYDAVKG